MKLIYALLARWRYFFTAFLFLFIGVIAGSDIGFKNGWMAFSNDYMAVATFHDRADAILPEADPKKLDAIWAECWVMAYENERAWQDLTLWERMKTPTRIYWKTAPSRPARLTAEERAKMKDELSQAGKPPAAEAP